MKLNLLITAVFILCSVSPAFSTQEAAEKGLAIARRADQVDRGYGDTTASLRMVLVSRHGDETVRRMRARFLEGKEDGDKSLLIFDNPKDVAGTAMLTHSHKDQSDEQWLYLPTLHRVKRISSTGKAGSFMGSEFSYEDLSSPELEKFRYTWLREENFNGLTCDVLERVPVDPDSGYVREEVWIDRNHSRTWKIIYFDRKRSLLKTLISSDFKLYDGRFWRAGKMHMTNHQSGKETVLYWENYAFHVGLSDSDFRKNVLKRIK